MSVCIRTILSAVSILCEVCVWVSAGGVWVGVCVGVLRCVCVWCVWVCVECVCGGVACVRGCVCVWPARASIIFLLGMFDNKIIFTLQL